MGKERRLHHQGVGITVYAQEIQNYEEKILSR